MKAVTKMNCTNVHCHHGYTCPHFGEHDHTPECAVKCRRSDMENAKCILDSEINNLHTEQTFEAVALKYGITSPAHLDEWLATKGDHYTGYTPIQDALEKKRRDGQECDNPEVYTP